MDKDLYKCKAIVNKEPFNTVCGYYYCGEMDIIIDGCGIKHAINPYSLCRNTGIKINNTYLYEFDLIEYGGGLSNPEMGFIEWDSFNNSYGIRSSLNYTGRRKLKGNKITIIGNIALNDDDYEKMQVYSVKQDESYKGITVEPECRSTQYLNKKMKQFLPK